MSANRSCSDRRHNIDRRAPNEQHTISLKTFVITVIVMIAIFVAILISTIINYENELDSFLSDDIIDITSIPKANQSTEEITINLNIDD